MKGDKDMKRYDYKEAMKADIRQYLEENWEKGKRITDDDRTQLHDDMFVADSVTGNGSGSYTFNSHEAEENVCHNLDLLGEALDEFCVDSETLRDKLDGEWADVTIRCYMLGQVEGEVFDAWNEECGEESDEDEEEEGRTMTKISKECIYDAVARDNNFAKCHRVTDWYWSGDDELVFCTNKRTHETEHYTVEEFIRQMANYLDGLEGCDTVEMSGDDWIFTKKGEE